MRSIYTLAVMLLFTVSSLAQNKACNCCSETHAEFDFWVGTWEVTNPNGTKAGENVIEKVQDNCILQENWTSATPGYTGTSNNFYNYKAKQWEQIWVDNQGQSLHLKGNKVGNQMILRTDDETNAEGKTFYHRVTWTDNEDGTVRQLWETITEGKEVAIAFDGLYKRKE
ncbi:hypothetical protein [Winogradskyella tangerina]|uniref:hypothetical protein n=1 Tax=Winogradskyella tangerina TaxID=2023240 RepID=UPI000DBE6B9D|nr:hypothetical protein [Winogradskyella tangerina]